MSYSSSSAPRSSMQVLDSTKESTQESIKILSNTIIVAEETCATLDRQDEQIRRAQENMDKIHHNLNYSDRLVRGIGSIWGAMTNYFTSAPSTATSTPPPQPKQPSPKPTFTRTPSASNKQSSGNGFTEDLLKQMTQDEKERYMQTESDLDAISDMMSTINQMANQMNTTLTSQNQRLDNLEGSVDSANARLQNTNLKIRKIM